ncbi:MAG: glycosyltransferase family 4 protein, partial [Rhodospirillaceae bacterium]|nr:glycosyltransferase family 4 protein [Rhodospirillaceae bacterium]
MTAPLRLGLDLRWLQRAWLKAPTGALGGMGIFAQNLVRGLAEAEEPPRLVALVDHGPVPEPLTTLVAAIPGSEIRACGLSGLWPRMDRRRKYAHLMHLIETESGFGMARALRGLDVLHMLDHTPPPRAARCPTVVTLHEFYDWVRQGWAVYRALCRRMTRADEVVGVSAVVAEDFAAHHALGRTRISHVHNGIDLSRFEPEAGRGDGERLRGLGLPARYLLHAGVMTHRKNPEGIFGAMGRLRAEGLDPPPLVSAGAYGAVPGALATIRGIAAANGVADRLIVLEKGASPDEMASLYRGAVGLVFPSHTEGFGLPAVEALACGTPCVVSNRSALPEVTGDLGIL